MDETPIRLHIEALDEGGFVATSPDVPGLVAEGETIDEVTAIANSLVAAFVESFHETGDPAPSALQDRVKAFC
jgi:predicted RNase H-like HicB family nuclease